MPTPDDVPVSRGAAFGRGLRQALLGGLGAVVVVAGYHVLVRPSLPAAPARPTDGSSMLERRLAALEAAVRNLRPAGPREAPAEAPTPTGPVRPEEADRARREEALAHFRAEVRRLAPGADAGSLEKATTLLADHAEALRALYLEMGAAKPEDLEALRLRHQRLTEELAARLAGLLPDDAVRSLTGRAPAR